MTKHCHACNTTRPVTEFSRNRARRDGLSTQCKVCVRARQAERYRTNPEPDKQRVSTYRKTNPEVEKARHRRYYEENRETVLEKCAQRRASDPMYPMRSRLSNGALKARNLGCVVEEFDSNDLELFWICNGISTTRCYYTGELLEADFHLDHMTPLSRGGAHAVTNLVPCSPFVNLSKNNQTANEYLNRETVPA